jgi:hypothetical protein
MNIPDKVKIGGINYNVIYTDVVDATNRNIDGQIIYDKQEIRLLKTMPAEYMECVFLHEIIHGAFDFCNIDNNEDVVRRLSTAMYQIVKDNPDIFYKLNTGKEVDI